LGNFGLVFGKFVSIKYVLGATLGEVDFTTLLEVAFEVVGEVVMATLGKVVKVIVGEVVGEVEVVVGYEVVGKAENTLLGGW
jgi:hypothetical protein